MENKELTPKAKRQRKFLLVLPLLALPFLTLMFWALGGGKTAEAKAEAKPQTGFNINLPDADLKNEKTMDKMSYYDKAATDSIKFREMEKNDPHFKNSDSMGQNINPFNPSINRSGLNTSLSGNGNDQNTENIYRRLELIKGELNRPVQQPYTAAPYQTSFNRPQNAVQSLNVERLEQMMQNMNQSDGQDPEMQQLTGMMDKILDIQHPERVQERLKESNKAKQGKTFTVTTKNKDLPITLLDKRPGTATYSNSFFSLEDTTALQDIENAIPAVIHETQTLLNGSTVKLRLQTDIYVNGIKVPKDSFIFGTASLSGERLTIDIKSLRYKRSVFPVELEVFDMDALAGIYVPGALTRDVAAQSADRSTQNIGLNTLDGSWGVQAAGAGIEAAKTLFSKKIKLTKVTVKAGYQVLLRDTKQKQAKIELSNEND